MSSEECMQAQYDNYAGLKRNLKEKGGKIMIPYFKALISI
jgi:hypothetical protein